MTSIRSCGCTRTRKQWRRRFSTGWFDYQLPPAKVGGIVPRNTDGDRPRVLTYFVPFPSLEREANGLALVIVRAKAGAKGRIVVTASGKGLREGVAAVTAMAGR
jgi:hypothetical protein